MLHYDPQHVSSSTLLILRKTNCITTASGIVTLCKQPYNMKIESGLWVPSNQRFFQFANLMHNFFILQQYVCYITILNMFRAARCSSSGRQIVLPQPLISSPSVNSRTVCRWRADECKIPLFFNNMYVTLRSSTCFEQHAAHPQEDKLYHHSLWYRHPL
jgi:hypothetical protein